MRTDIREGKRGNDLSVCVSQKGIVNVTRISNFTASVYFSRITPSFSGPLSRLVGAKNHNIYHLTMHGFARSYCSASSALAFLTRNGELRYPHVPVKCVGCDRVQADHAPDGGVAQGIFHGILVRHHGRNQEEVEEGLEEEVERDKEEDNAQTTTCTCMDGMR